MYYSIDNKLSYSDKTKKVLSDKFKKQNPKTLCGESL